MDIHRLISHKEQNVTKVVQHWEGKKLRENICDVLGRFNMVEVMKSLVGAVFRECILKSMCLPLVETCLFMASALAAKLSVDTIDDAMMISFSGQGHLVDISQNNLRIQVTCLIQLKKATYQLRSTKSKRQTASTISRQ